MPDPRPKRDRSPSDIPSKVCPACGRPFTWRRKWSKDWDNVIYCSERCRKAGKPA